MCTYEQIRSGLGALDNLIQWDHANLPQDPQAREVFLSCMLGEVDIDADIFNTRYLEPNNRFHGQLQQFLTDLGWCLMDTPGGRKIAMMLMEYPGQALGWRFNNHQVPMYGRFTQRIMKEIMSSDVWRPDNANELIANVLATKRTDADLLTFKLLM